MKTSIATCALLAAVTITAHADTKDLAGRWIGQVFTDRGDMEIALQLRIEKDKLMGTLETMHGEWVVASVTEQDGGIVVAFTAPEGKATMRGRLNGAKFTGDWTSHMASGRFELLRSKRL